MPADFEKCRREGGRIRTLDDSHENIPKGHYMRICIDKNGKSHAGEVKKKKSFLDGKV